MLHYFYSYEMDDCYVKEKVLATKKCNQDFIFIFGYHADSYREIDG